jgi:hypothetical protein
LTVLSAPEIPPERAVKTATVATTTTARTTAYSAIVCPCWRRCRALMRSRSGESVIPRTVVELAERTIPTPGELPRPSAIVVSREPCVVWWERAA